MHHTCRRGAQIKPSAFRGTHPDAQPCASVVTPPPKPLHCCRKCLGVNMYDCDGERAEASARAAEDMKAFFRGDGQQQP